MKDARAPMLALTCALASARAGAVDVWRLDGDSGELVVVDAHGFYKPFGSRTTLSHGLVEATGELDRAVTEARESADTASAPSSTTSGMSEDAPAIALPEHVWTTSHTLRLASHARFVDTLDLDVAWQGTAALASDPRFVPGARGAFGTTAQAPARRLVDFDPVLVSADGFALVHNLDQLALSFHSSGVNVVVGRQVVSWGTGHLWNPTDLFSPFAPTDVDREVRRGADAVRVSVPLGDTTEIDVLYLPQPRALDQGAVLRARTNLFDTADVSVTAAKYVGDIVLGADTAADAGPFGVHAEAAWTLPIGGALATGDTARVDVDDSFVRAVAGAAWRPFESLTLIGEYHYNGFGADDPSGYLDKLRSARVARGEVFGAARHYVGAASAWTIDDLTSVSGTAIVNVLDPSALLVTAFERSLASNVLVRAGATFPFGADIAAARFHALTGDDVLTQSDAFTKATDDLGVRSEFGLTPFTVFVQLGAYFG